jgi:non-heme Fe2+,alpha-ketoglutarate-dependent halogenase
MAKLTRDQVDRYGKDGILFPLRVMSPSEAGEALRHFQDFEGHVGGAITSYTKLNVKPHLVLPWLNDMIRHPAILDAVESLLGPDILCWGSNFFAKRPGDGAFVTWHQDATYFDLSNPDVVTAWVAFTPSTQDSGCMQVIPGTQSVQAPHHDVQSAGNMLPRGQEIAVAVERSQAVDVVLQPGEMSLHHVLIHHGSEVNHSPLPRVGYAIRYLPTRLRQLSTRTSATLVRGVDRYGHFDLEPSPAADFDPEALAVHQEADRRLSVLRFAGLDAEPPRV